MESSSQAALRGNQLSVQLLTAEVVCSKAAENRTLSILSSFLIGWEHRLLIAFALSVSRTFPSTVLSPGDQGSQVPEVMVLSRRVMAHLLLTCPSRLPRRINYFQFFLSIHPSYSSTQMFQFVSSKITWVDPARWLCNWKGSPTSLRKEQVEAKNQLWKVVLWPSCSCVCTCILMLTHTHK